MKRLFTFFVFVLSGVFCFAQSQLYRFDTVSQLTNLTIPVVNVNLTAIVSGRNTTNDGLGGVWTYFTNRTDTVNGYSVVAPKPPFSGRWMLSFGASETNLSVAGNAAISNTLTVSNLIVLGTNNIGGGGGGGTSNAIPITNGTSVHLTLTAGTTNSDATASRAAIFNAGKVLTNSVTTDTELGYVSGVTSAIQTQLNTLTASDAGRMSATNGISTGQIATNITMKNAVLTNATPSRAVIVDATDHLTNSAVTDTELSYVSGVTSSIQTQINGLSGGSGFVPVTNGTSVHLTLTAGTTNSDATASRAAIFNAGKVLTNSPTTDTELGYVNGVTSAIQTQINAVSNAIPSIAGKLNTTNGTSVGMTFSGVTTNASGSVQTGDIHLTNSVEYLDVNTGHSGYGLYLTYNGTNVGQLSLNTPSGSGELAVMLGASGGSLSSQYGLALRSGGAEAAMFHSNRTFIVEYDQTNLASLTVASNLTVSGNVAITGDQTNSGFAGFKKTITASGGINVPTGNIVMSAGDVVVTGNGGFSGPVTNSGGAIFPTLTASRAALIDSAGNLTNSSATSTELGYLSGVTSAIQTQINGISSTGKLNATNGTSVGLTLSTITTNSGGLVESTLTASRAVIIDASNNLTNSSVTSTELSYVSGATSSLQTQINGVSGVGKLNITNGTAIGLSITNGFTNQWLPGGLLQTTGVGNVVTNIALTNGVIPMFSASNLVASPFTVVANSGSTNTGVYTTNAPIALMDIAGTLNVQNLQALTIPTGGGGNSVYTNSTTNEVHVFTSSGTFTSTVSMLVNYLIVGGGGGGGNGQGGGGGAGGMRTGSVTLPGGTYTITVGSGGGGGGQGNTGGANGTNGGDSIFNGITATGGGGGASGATNGLSGGSGGGAGGSGTVGGTNSPQVSPMQGTNGGAGAGAANYAAGGGGGASAVGANGSEGGTGGNGGAGTATSITGTNTTYAGGGGGGRTTVPGAGGAGGGGGGTGGHVTATNGTANTGGGGGGARNDNNSSGVFGGAGGSGIVVISFSTNGLYASAGQLFFNSSGYLGLGLTNATHQLQLSTDDAYKLTTGTWSYASDDRTKKNIVSYSKGLADFLQIPITSWQYNGKLGTPDNTFGVGPTAQALEQILPNSVRTEIINDPIKGPSEIKTVNPHEYWMLSAQAVWELSAKVDALTARVVDLESQIFPLSPPMDPPVMDQNTNQVQQLPP